MNSILPTEAQARKEIPLYRGLFQYFPRALCAVAHLSWKGNQQHHPDKPLHWDKSKSTDELDALLRHIIDEDWDAVAWRALANLERKLSTEFVAEPVPDGPDEEYPLDHHGYPNHPENVHELMRKMRRDPNQ